MKSLKRYDIRDAFYFITVVTYGRKKILTENMDIFWKSWKDNKLYAWVILPDHFHAITEVYENSISEIIHKFKLQYYHRVSSRFRNKRIWQNRFWDHIIRNERDMNQHLDYIHYNPVKHGLIDDPFKYEYSSLHGFFEEGYYQRDWGVIEKPKFEGGFGE